jgi:hypothetical protein
MTPLERKRAFLFRWALPYGLTAAVLFWQWRPWSARPTHEHLLYAVLSLAIFAILFFVIRGQAGGHFDIDEDSMPAWRRKIRKAIAPYRRVAALAVILLMALAWANSAFDWGLLNLDGRKSEGVALVVGFIWLVFAAPTARESNSQKGPDGTNSEP